MLNLIKSLHTMIWAVMAAATFYIFYCVTFMAFDNLFRAAVLLIIAEIAVLVANKWVCPLTSLAAKYTTNRAANFDIFLPEMIAAHNVKIFSTLFVIIVAIYFYN